MKTNTQKKIIAVGDAVARPGELVYGFFDEHTLPTGGIERLPVLIAQGREAGPCFWLTANIHGDELTGLLAIQETVIPTLAAQLRGTVVAIPSLNPAGLRTGTRRAYYDQSDPNRTFPGWQKSSGDKLKDAEEARHPTVFEEAHARLFKHILETADFLIDLHCYGHQATPFSIRDRVLYRAENATDELPRAENLAARTDSLMHAFGLPIVNEYVAGRFILEKLHRSTSAAALYEAHIPAFTVELGATDWVDLAALKAAKQGLLNALRWAEMLPDEPEPVTVIPQPQVDFRTMRATLPKAPCSGIIRYWVQPGQVVQTGELLATIRDIYGRTLTEIVAPQSGWVMSLSAGAVIYQGQSVVNMAIKDDGPLVVPFPTE